MKAYTDIEQSKKLAKILSLESADMYYLIKRDDCRVSWEEAAKDDTNVILFTMEVMSGNLSDYKLPCWSLAALLDVIPQVKIDNIKQYDKKLWRCCAYFASDWHNSDWFDNPIDACYELILKLHA